MRATSHDRLDPLTEIIGCSPAMDHVRMLIGHAAYAIVDGKISILILGETGTGKELVAQSIVRLSRMKVVPINCAELTDDLAVSELFGHERGAFTSAVNATSGLIAAADGGILFLDEMAELSLRIQAKLLRTLDSGDYRRVGSTRPLKSEFRHLSATNADVDARVAQGKMRRDFLERLDGLRIVLPPLRERPDDIPPLASHFLRRWQDGRQDGPRRITERAMQLLISHEWPGNVREVRRVVFVACEFARLACCVDVEHIEQALAPALLASPAPPVLPTLEEARRAAEQRVMDQALAWTSGNRKEAAALLKTSESTFHRLRKNRRSDSQNGRKPSGQRSTQ